MKAELVLGNLKRERDALDTKLERLANALEKDWQDADQEYLCTQQYNAMQLYAHILDERILDIEYKLEQKKTKLKEKIAHETSHKDDKMFKENLNLNSYEKNTNNKYTEDRDIYNGKVYASIGELMKDIFGIDVFCDESE